MDIGLARVSTTEQDPALQEAALRKAACDEVIVRRLSSVSAEWASLRARIIRGLAPGDTLTVWKLDRLGRSLQDLRDIVYGLRDRGVNFRSLTEGIDTSTAQGDLFFTILAAFAEFERKIIIERTLAGKANRAANGLHPGGARGYGFEPDRTTVIQAEAAILREAADRVLAGEPLAKVVDSLNASGVPTATGKGRWNESTIRRTLLRDDLVPAILPPETHASLEALFAPKQDRQRLGAPARHLLSGILRCQCGAAMRVVNQRERNGARHLVYRCRKVSGGRDGGCGTVSIRVDRVEPFIVNAVKETMIGEEFISSLNARRAALLPEAGQDLDELRVELADYQNLPARFRTPQTNARAAELERLLRAAQARLLAAPELAELLDLPRTAEAFDRAWSDWDMAERRRKLRLLLRSVTVKHTGKGRKPFDPSRLDPDWRV